jgi:hypothetical protein
MFARKQPSKKTYDELHIYMLTYTYCVDMIAGMLH